jgi:hypothetical protein
MQVVQVPAPPVPYPPTIWFEDVVLPLLGIAVGVFVLWQVFRLLHRRLDQGSGGGAAELEAMRTELEQVRAQAEEVPLLRERVIELEERLDFAERVLTKQGREGLPGGES